MSRILPIEDEEVSKAMAMVYKKRGIEILTESRVEAVEIKKDRCKVTVKTKNGEVTLESDIVLSAAGVQTNLENLGLEEMGIKSDKGKVVVDDFYRTSAPGVYAIGDVAGAPWLAHKASHEGISCIDAILGKHRHSSKFIPGCVYTLPGVASVGLTEAVAIERGHTLKVGRFPLQANGKALAMGTPEGLIKLIFDAQTGGLLGAHMIGHEVTEMIHSMALALHMEATEEDLHHVVFPHPTLSEAIHEASLDAYGQVLHM
jgi:dihydrolipoamide dehydrogenase